MILEMEKLTVFGLHADREKVLNKLMRRRCVQIRPADAMDDYEQIAQMTESAPVESYELEQQLSRYRTALNNINFYATKGGLFSQKPRVQYDKLEDSAMLTAAEEQCAKIERISGEMADKRAQKSKDAFTLASLTPWAENDLPVELAETRTTSILYYLLPSKADMQEMEEQIAEQSLVCLLQKVGEDKEQRYLQVFVHKSDEGRLWDILKTYGVTRMGFEGMQGTVQENIVTLEKRIQDCDQAIAGLEAELRVIGQDIFALKYGVDAISVRVQREKAGLSIRNTEKTFCFTAWVPTVKRDEAASILDKAGCYYELGKPRDDEEPPILLKNNAWATNFEAVTDMYSPPAYRGFDPNAIMSVFYFIIFGMMMSDAGFGLVLFFGGMWLGKKLDMGPGGKKLIKVIQWGGLSAIIWGTIYGSWFGDLIPVVAETFFGKTVTVPMLIDPLQDAVLVMAMAMALGFIHLMVGLGIKGYMMIKRGHVLDAVFDIGFWYLLLFGLVGMLAAMILLSTDHLIFKAGAVSAVVGAAGLILTQGRDKKNPIVRIGSGIMSLYDVTGYLSDVLSYSRILALGLATGVIAQVANIMGTLLGGGIGGALLLIVVFAIMSAINVGINTLGAYVHTARLQYVEFFGKFYEAGGRPFAPLAPQTKYIVVTNEEE